MANSSENPNEQAREYLEQVFNSWVQTGYDEEKDIVFRSPQTKKQIESSQNLLNKAKALKPDDEWVVNRIKELQGVLDHQLKRAFTGKKFIPIALIIYAILFYLLPVIFLTPEVSMENAASWRSEQIERLQQYIPRLKQRIANAEAGTGDYSEMPENERNERLEKMHASLDKREKKISEYKALSDDELMKTCETRNRTNKASRLFTGIIFLITGIFYKKALSAPSYLIDRRAKQTAAWAAVGGFFTMIYLKVTKALTVDQPSGWTTKTTYSSGRTSTEFTANPIPLIGCVFAIATPICVLLYVLLFSPLVVIISYLRNYVWHK